VIGLTETAITRESEGAEICLTWLSLKETDVDYQLFVHVLDGATIAAQVDRQPKEGQYPTGVWRQGELVEDCFAVQLPDDGGWQIDLGLYNLVDGLRLPLVNKNGQRLPNDSLVLSPKKDNS